VSSASRKKNAPAGRRRELVEGILAAGRESSAATVMLHTAIAERSGLAATDTKTIDTLIRLGPVTAGELAGYTGLATASVTSLIDRLEKRTWSAGHEIREIGAALSSNPSSNASPTARTCSARFAKGLHGYWRTTTTSNWRRSSISCIVLPIGRAN
jgi:hypothetical protein